MTDFLAQHYLALKALHLISVISWMCGLLYLPRLFVYHVGTEKKSPQYEVFLTMERKLIRIIMNPAAILSFIFGFALILTPGVWQKGVYWLHLKIMLVFFMGIVHVLSIYWYQQFRSYQITKTGTFFRFFNEIPAVIMIGIVLLAVIKPF
jgi:putative membrane protein